LGFVEQEENRYAAEFWSGIVPKKVSVLPSRTAKTLAELGATQWLAHLGNGVIHYRGGVTREHHGVPAELQNLMERVKNEFDPNRIFPNYNDDRAA
jgi:hypothetical protein